MRLSAPVPGSDLTILLDADRIFGKYPLIAEGQSTTFVDDDGDVMHRRMQIHHFVSFSSVTCGAAMTGKHDARGR